VHVTGVVSEVDLNEVMLGSLYKLEASDRKSKSSSNKKPRMCFKIYNCDFFAISETSRRDFF
jgi:hypothetical protein